MIANSTGIRRKPVYTEHKNWSQWSSHYIRKTICFVLIFPMEEDNGLDYYPLTWTSFLRKCIPLTYSPVINILHNHYGVIECITNKPPTLMIMSKDWLASIWNQDNVQRYVYLKRKISSLSWKGNNNTHSKNMWYTYEKSFDNCDFITRISHMVDSDVTHDNASYIR